VTGHTLTRREFLRQTGAAAIVAGTGMPLLAAVGEKKHSKVVLIRHSEVLDDDGDLNESILEGMFDEAVAAVFGVNSAGEAWKLIARPADVVGIKTNVWKLRTPTALEDIMKSRLMEAGVRRENLAVDDRGVLSNPVFQKSTVLINARPMRAHNWSGVGGCLKNYIMFSPRPADYHPNSCVDLGAIWNLPIVRGKTRLNVLVMLTPQFNCLGPHHFDRESLWPYKGLLVGTDPVALDAIGLKIITAKRREVFGEDSPVRPPVTHIKAAEEKHGVGVADPSRIEVVRLGWSDGALL